MVGSEPLSHGPRNDSPFYAGPGTERSVPGSPRGPEHMGPEDMGRRV